MFGRVTGFTELDDTVARIRANKDEVLLVLERPEIPLHTHASENDIRTGVIKRKISGGTMSDAGRDARDIMLGLMKTCRKLGVSFTYLGDCLGLNTPGSQVPPLARGLSRWAHLLVKGASLDQSGAHVFNGLAGSRGAGPGPETPFTCPT